MCNAHPYFSLKNLGKNVCIIHSKTRWSLRPVNYGYILTPEFPGFPTSFGCLIIPVGLVHRLEQHQIQKVHNARRRVGLCHGPRPLENA